MRATDVIGRDAELARTEALPRRLRGWPERARDRGRGRVPARRRSGSPAWRRRASAATACSRPARGGGGGAAVRRSRRPGREHARRGARRAAGAASRALRVALLLASPGDAPPDERAVAVAVLGVLRELAGAGPVLVAVDDVQWLDPPSAKVASFAWRRLREEPVGLLLAHRLGTDAPAGLVGRRPLLLHSQSGRSRSAPCTGCCTRGWGSSCRGPRCAGSTR